MQSRTNGLKNSAYFVKLFCAFLGFGVLITLSACNEKSEKTSDTGPKLESIIQTANATPTDTLKFLVNGMSCSGCVMSVKSAAKPVKGVVDCNVILEDSIATVTWNAKAEGASKEKLMSAFNETGYVFTEIARGESIAPADSTL